jgi:hypothetical protein
MEDNDRKEIDTYNIFKKHNLVGRINKKLTKKKAMKISKKKCPDKYCSRCNNRIYYSKKYYGDEE